MIMKRAPNKVYFQWACRTTIPYVDDDDSEMKNNQYVPLLRINELE